MPSKPLSELVVRDPAAWRRWLGANHARSQGVRLVVSKRGTTTPTRLTHHTALEEALSYGWIDGQAQGRDEATWIVRFTPRRRRSRWSKRNTVIAERLISEGRMRAAGLAEIERAKSDGRWDNAYEGSASIQVPADLVAALETEPEAKAMFAILSATNRYAVLYRIHEAKRPETRARRIQQLVAMLARHETLHPQRKTQ